MEEAGERIPGGDGGYRGAAAGGPRWQRQVNSWNEVAAKFGLEPDRYVDFEYLLYMPLDDEFVINYVRFQLGLEDPIIKHRIRHHKDFWKTITDLPWLLDIVENGVALPFAKEPPSIVLPNNKSAVTAEMVPWVRNTIKEYLAYGFVCRVNSIPKCVMPLQVKNTGGKTALIYDMSVLNDYIEKKKFKLESWEEMFN